MNLLLDTHAFIWYTMDADKLSGKALAIIQAAENPLFISQASIWEMQIKHNIGKLELPFTVQEMVDTQLAKNAFSCLRISNQHLWQLETLPHIHKDPFDRMLVCQAQCENLTLITRDGHIKEYDVPTLW